MDKSNNELLQKLHEMVGAIKMADATGSMLGGIKSTFVKQIKESKAYKPFGYDWHSFCKELLKKDHKTVDLELKFLDEYGENFIKTVEKIGVTKRELLALGSGLPEDARAGIKKGVIKIGDDEFKVEELEDNLDEFKTALNGLNERLEETSKKVKAQERVAENNHKTIEKLHKELDAVKKKEDNPSLTDDEEEFLKAMQNLRIGFDGYMLKLDPERIASFKNDDKVTPRMRAAYIETLGYMRKQILFAYDEAVTNHGGPSMCPEDAWTPGKK